MTVARVWKHQDPPAPQHPVYGGWSVVRDALADVAEAVRIRDRGWIYDAVVCTPASWKKLSAELQLPVQPVGYERLYGIPVYTYPTFGHCLAHTEKMRMFERKRVLLVTE